MKRYLYFLCFVVLVGSINACKKNDDPVAASPVVGRWTLNRGIANSFPTSASINGAPLDLYSINAEGSTLDIFADNTFNENYRSTFVSDGEGTWVYTNNNLTLTYNSGQNDSYTYSKTKNIEELTSTVSYDITLPLSATGVRGKVQWVFRK